MREILFRGKKKPWGGWAEGSLVKMRDYYRISEKNDMISFGVETETIGQYTGLTDKNGKKIFEGDIVQHDFGADQIGVQYAVVEYDTKYASFMIKPIYDWMFCDKNDCEVIGNIHDNPELVKELGK